MIGRRGRDADESHAGQSRAGVVVRGRATGQLLLLVVAGIEGGRSRQLRGGELGLGRAAVDGGRGLCVDGRQGIWVEGGRRCS